MCKANLEQVEITGGTIGKEDIEDVENKGE